MKGVRGFLGLTSYYRRFIVNYGKIAKPLTEITKKDAFHWNLETNLAFEELKRAVTSALVLAYPDFSIPFEVECDASGKGVGAVLMQQRKPIAYFSKAFSGANLSKSTYEKELMAVALAIQHWRHYLLGRKFTIFNDHKSLKFLMEQRITTSAQQEWMARFVGFQFDVVYKAGVDNKAADALSRQYEDVVLNSIVSFPIWQQGKQVQEEVAKAPFLSEIIAAVRQDPNAKPGYDIVGEILFFKGRLVLSSKSDLIPTLLKEFHETPTGGIRGF